MEGRKTAHTDSELQTIYEEHKFEKKYFSNFVDYYHLCFDELYQDMKDYSDEDFESEDDSIQASALSISIDYMHAFIELINKGHGETWAHEMAHSNEDVERAAYFSYHDMKAENPEQAEKEMLLYCKNTGGDEFFQKHFFFFFREMENPANIVEKATTYSDTYKEQIKKGKSEIYAHEYAFFLADDYNEIYCEDYAYAYEQAIVQNKSLEYAERYADEYASALVNIKCRSGICDDEDMISFAIEKVNALMISWEYANEHELNDRKSFMAIYARIHLDTYYADEPLQPYMSEEEMNKMIMEKVLAEYERRGGK